MKKKIVVSLCIASSLVADAKIDAIKEQLEQQKHLTQQLTEQVELLKQKQNATANQSASFSQNAYLPDIALILNMSAVGRNVKNSDYENNTTIPGFIEDGEMELPFNKNKGLNFNYAEIAMHSVVDPYFEAFAMFHLHPDAFEIGEAYVQTTSLPYAMRIRAGKFKSHFGRINSKHQHAWHFDSQPLIYKALFGPDSISDPGIQLQWMAPTDTYIMAGAEMMQGSNERSFGDSEKYLYIGYLKSSIDIGDTLSVLGGVSFAHGNNTATKPTDIYGIDFTLRDQLGAYSAFIWQSEFLQRNKEQNTLTQKQAGLYSEMVYQYNNNYTCGIRYDRITKNDSDLSNYSGIDTANLDRYTVMAQYKPFPMSRLRLSYTYDRSKVVAGERKDINEVMLSLNIAAGAHGAHDY